MKNLSRIFCVASVLSPICAILAFTPTTLLAEIYKQVQPDGSVIFTDQPQEGTEREKVKLKPTAIIPAVDSANISTQPQSKSTKVKYTLNLLSPASGSTFRNEQADAIGFKFNVSPTIRSPYKLTATLNGNTIDPQSGVLPKLYRGEHTLKVQVIDKNGQEAVSATSTFFVHRFAGG